MKTKKVSTSIIISRFWNRLIIRGFSKSWNVWNCECIRCSFDRMTVFKISLTYQWILKSQKNPYLCIFPGGGVQNPHTVFLEYNPKCQWYDVQHFLHISTKQVFGDNVRDGFPYQFGLAWGPETISNMCIAPRGGRTAWPDDGGAPAPLNPG